jgi:hypothetical protein
MRRNRGSWDYLCGLTRIAVAAALVLIGTVCSSGGGSASPGGNSRSSDDNVLLTDALSYKGSVSGKAFDSQSTRESFDATEAAQTIPPEFETGDTSVRFMDLEGNALLDANGDPIPAVSMNSDGSFTATGLPIGTDFIICVDVGSDGTCDLERCVNIPQGDQGDEGALTDVRVDPLTRLVLAKLRDLIEKRGIDLRDLNISPAAVVTRIVEAYTNLFEESGIEHTVTLEDIKALTAEQLAELFDSALPAAVQTGMQIVDGNLRAVQAADAEALASAIAEVFVRAGFPIVDLPGPPDLSSLAELEGVVTIPQSELFGPGPPPFDDGGELPEDSEGEYHDEGLGPAQASDDLHDPFPDMLVYMSTLTEPDRNFASGEEDEDSEGGPGPMMPMLNDYILVEMARLHLAGRVITLDDLYALVTDLQYGLGARLTYFIHDPTFFGPPLNVFETTDGAGRAINLDELFRGFFESGFDDFDPEAFERREQELRRMLQELLGDTIPPTFERLFDGFARERIADVEELAHGIREARAHLPFNRSGSSAFFVVADGDPFRRMDPHEDEEGLTEIDVHEVTVDAVVSVEGDVSSIMYNPSHDGAFYLGFGPRTEEDGVVELIVRETGRFLHGHHGPAGASIYDESIFQPVNGRAFADFVSESGIFYPGVNVTVVRDEFVPLGPEPMPEPLPEPEPASGPEPEPGPMDIAPAQSNDPMAGPEGEAQGPHQQLFVLATGIGFDAEPVRVDYDRASGTATYNPGGRHLLAFEPDSHETGMFALFNEDTGRHASLIDPEDFFMAPPEMPDGYENFYNEFDEYGGFDDFEHIDEFVDDWINEHPPDGDYPPPPPDGDEPPPPPPPDGDELPPPPPPDGDEPPPPPPPDGQVLPPPPPDGDVPLPPPPPDGDDGMFNDGPPPDPGFILIRAEHVIGLDLTRQAFTHVFGIEVPNSRYNADEDPYYDDVNGDGVHDAGEPTAPFRPMLFDPRDWRATDVRLYYRRADNGESVSHDDIAFESETPQTRDGVELLPREYKTRLNAFRFGRPNTAINLLTAFAPPEFFDGTHGLDRETSVDIFMAVAIINLIMEQVFNVDANIDLDGLGPRPPEHMLIDAHMFVAPIGDPFQLVLEGFRQRTRVEERAPQ